MSDMTAMEAPLSVAGVPKDVALQMPPSVSSHSASEGERDQNEAPRDEVITEVFEYEALSSDDVSASSDEGGGLREVRAPSTKDKRKKDAMDWDASMRHKNTKDGRVLCPVCGVRPINPSTVTFEAEFHRCDSCYWHEKDRKVLAQRSRKKLLDESSTPVEHQRRCRACRARGHKDCDSRKPCNHCLDGHIVCSYESRKTSEETRKKRESNRARRRPHSALYEDESHDPASKRAKHDKVSPPSKSSKKATAATAAIPAAVLPVLETTEEGLPVKEYVEGDQYQQYLDIIYCSKCNTDDNDEFLLICEACMVKALHTYCCDPPLSAVPEGEWLCPDCEQKKAGETLEKSSSDIPLPESSAAASELSNYFEDHYKLPIEKERDRTESHTTSYKPSSALFFDKALDQPSASSVTKTASSSSSISLITAPSPSRAHSEPPEQRRLTVTVRPESSPPMSRTLLHPASAHFRPMVASFELGSSSTKRDGSSPQLYKGCALTSFQILNRCTWKEVAMFCNESGISTEGKMVDVIDRVSVYCSNAVPLPPPLASKKKI